MSELVTIGGQQFIYDKDKGWIDKKTKVPADENLLKLLNTVSPSRSMTKVAEVKEEKPEEKQEVLPKKIKARKINSVDPINIGGQRYIFTNAGWVDEKTKVPAPKNLLPLFDKLVPNAKEAMGALGEAAAAKVKEKTSKPKPISTISKPKINKLFVKMIHELAQIDSMMNAKFKAVSANSNQSILNKRENIIEDVGDKAQEIKQQIETEQASPLSKIGGVAALAALIAIQFDPIKDQIKALWDITEKSATYVNDLAKTLNGFFEWFGSGKNSSQQEDEEITAGHTAPKQPKIINHPSEWSMPPAPKPQTPKQSQTPTTKMPAAPSNTNSKQPKIINHPSEWSMPPAPNSKSSSSPATVVNKPTTSQSSPKPMYNIGPLANKQNDVKKPIQFVDGVPKNDMMALRRWLIAQGFTPSEQDGPDGRIKTGHSKNSKHYSGQAIDVNIGSGNTEANHPVYGPKFDILAKQLRDAGYSVIWRAPKHYDHLHVQIGGKSNVGGSSGYGETFDNMKDAVVEGATESWKKLVSVMKAVGATDTEFRQIGTKKANIINDAAKQRTKKIVESRDKKKAPKQVMELPNLNQNGGTIKLPAATSTNKDVVDEYIRYFKN